MSFEAIVRHSQQDIDAKLISLFGEKYKAYRELWHSSTRNCVPKFPVHLDIELVDSCNQACIMCPRNTDYFPNLEYELGTNKRISFSQVQAVIDEGVLNGLNSVNFGAFAEPLVYKELFNLVRYAMNAGIVDTRVITNGLLLARHVEAVFDSGLVHLFVSLDAAKESTYQKIRGHGFAKAVSGLEAVIAEKQRRGSILPIIRVSFVDLPENHAEKAAFIETWAHRVDFIDIQAFADTTHTKARLIDYAGPKLWDCEAPWKRLSVLANGDIIPCCAFLGRNLPLGNIGSSTLLAAWNSEELAKVRQGIIEDNLKSCTHCQRT